MSFRSSRLARRLLAAAGLCVLLPAGAATALSAQELALKRTVPRPGNVSCPRLPPPGSVSEEERDEAGRLSSSAEQALILGDQARARDLLARAVELDPASGELAYRYARILQDLGERQEAMDELCRTMSLGPGEEVAADARARLEVLAAMDRPQVPDEAVTAFQSGVAAADALRLEVAEQAFDAAVALAPEWADAVFDRGVVRARLGKGTEAAADLQHYLALEPDAPDAMLVSQRIGQLQIAPPLPRPGTALGLGLVLPGLGQFYSGRTFGGLTVLALAGSAAVAGMVVKKVTVRCVGVSPSGGDCPPDRLVGENTERPYLIPGLAAAGAVGFIGAVEAYIRARRRITASAEEEGGPDRGTLHLAGPSLGTRGSRLTLSLIGVRF